MPKPTNTEGRVWVPDDAAIAVAKRRHPLLSSYEERHQAQVLTNARKDIAAALPSLEDSFKERVREAVKERLIEDEALMKIIAAAEKPYPSLMREAEAVSAAVLDYIDAALDSEDHRG